MALLESSVMLFDRIAGPRTSRLDRHGLTLMELLVVIVILVALGSILIPMLPNMLQKAHIAQTATNISEIDKAVQSYQTANLRYPDYFDSLLDASGNLYAGGAFMTATYTNSAGVGGPSFAIGTLTQGQADSLISAMSGASLNTTSATQTTSGAHLVAMKTTPKDATFDAYNITNGIPASNNIASGTKVLVAADNYIQQVMRARQKTDATGAASAMYVVVGLGPYCTIVGDTSFGIMQAPVCFGEVQTENPKLSYARMLCVFRVYNDGTRAEYVGSAHPGHDGLGTAEDHIAEYYKTN